MLIEDISRITSTLIDQFQTKNLLNHVKRRVLLPCKESYAWPIHYLAKQLRKEGDEIFVFFVMPYEAMREDYDFREFRRVNPDLNIITAKEVGEEYIRRVRSGKLDVDYDYLSEIDQKFSRWKHLGLQQISSQFLSAYSHYRTYYHDVPAENQLLLMQLYYQFAEKILDDLRPDVIYDADFAEFPRAILFELSYDRKIPYVTIESSRFEDFFLPSTTLALNDAAWIKPLVDERAEKLRTLPDRNRRSGRMALTEFRGKKAILAEGFKGAFEVMRFRPIWAAIGILRGMKNHVPTQIKDWFRYYRYVRSPLFADPIASNLLDIKTYFRRLYIHFRTPFESTDLNSLKYILFPLHMIPESSTLTKAPFFLDEEFLIESLSKSVPPGMTILVKEHWYMLGERPLSFYERLKRIPNVVLIEPRKYGDPRNYLENAVGVVTITGSTAFEAALLGKPSVVFGPTPFAVLNSVTELTDVTKLPAVLRSWKKNLSEDVELEAYLEVVTEYGRKLDMPCLTSREHETDVAKAIDQAKHLYEVFKIGEKIARTNFAASHK